MEKHVYIIGSKGIPAKYGGFETFVDKLTRYQTPDLVHYHIACMSENSAKSGITDRKFRYNNAECFNINVPSIGPARAILYDILALKRAITISKRNKDYQPIFYVLACRIGPFIGNMKKEIKKIGGKLYVNPDGNEWKRAKWSYPVRKYWKQSERLMVKHSDLLICDSKNIEIYIKKEYVQYQPKTIFIAYGADFESSKLTRRDSVVSEWFEKWEIIENEYYLLVGRFVPENNYEAIINSFKVSSSKKDLVIVTNVEKNNFFNSLKKQTHFDEDSKIKFVGTVYDQKLLTYIRENTFAYIHGHEVGGTNPSLLEALSATELNLLLDVGFNREVAEEGALYWEKNNLVNCIEQAESLEDKDKHELAQYASKRMADLYSWSEIVGKYEELFRR
ncbi:beta 1-4 rhamnosyltransferase Cps2T [Enterococcus pseudoavium]|uniref:beta 1-4 rhamnosyltransferase Cps2T n=1 Tax=Enterococcus pseudoavium TaxID=44007 RepID=UPI00082C0607|nr:DUF1972 domain-containing protein [Enterococcus pseudoavium]REC32404.1 glycosyltransferase family 1 protein [Enterococcus pseudoavium]